METYEKSAVFVAVEALKLSEEREEQAHEEVISANDCKTILDRAQALERAKLYSQGLATQAQEAKNAIKAAREAAEREYNAQEGK